MMLKFGMDPRCPFALCKTVGTGRLFHVGIQMHHLAHNEEHRKQSLMQNEGAKDKGEEKRNIHKTQAILTLSRFRIYKLHLDICRHVATIAAL